MNGSFKWNEVEERKEVDNRGKKPKYGRPATVSDETETVVEEQSNLVEDTDHRFELRDVSVKFPEGELTVVTGPTASGKTALLVISCLRHIYAFDGF